MLRTCVSAMGGGLRPACAIARRTVVGSTASQAASLSTGTGAAAASPSGGRNKKYKNRFKRATSTMAEVTQDAYQRMKMNRARQRGGALPHFEVGDAVLVRYAFELSNPKPGRFKGIVIAKKNKGIDSKFTIMNAVDDDIITMSFPYSSPLLKEVQVYKKWHLHGGKRRCRKAKLYYLLDKPVDEWKVK